MILLLFYLQSYLWHGAVPLTDHLSMHLSALEQMFGEIDSLFAQGSDFGDTNAKDTIWSKPEQFQQAINQARNALATLRQVVEQGDKTKFKQAFRDFGRSSCGNCHKSFKKKQN